jgi:cytochrome d ubiquinol oxidase subunit II
MPYTTILSKQKTMTETIIAILGISVLLYVLLGGADFGAGIVEMLVGKKGTDTISKAIAPVWEANHVWIILAVVILFNGFPLAYTVMSTYLHIPLLLVLIGIIIRGTAFSFRYYDVISGNVHSYYSWFFRTSSVITPFFLGMVLGAAILGRIPLDTNGSFTEIFIRPWLNVFTVSTGLFMILLFGWIASVYLIGETEEKTFPVFRKTSLVLFIALIISGGLVFLAAEKTGLHLLRKFSVSPISIISVMLATLLIPVMWRNISRKNVFWTRMLAGVITACILVGWFAVQFPVLVNRAEGQNLTIWNSRAPDVTMYYLLAALIVGIFIIFPAFAYLFKVFKFSKESE